MSYIVKQKHTECTKRVEEDLYNARRVMTDLVEKGREQALVITKIDEAIQWLQSKYQD